MIWWRIEYRDMTWFDWQVIKREFIAFIFSSSRLRDSLWDQPKFRFLSQNYLFVLSLLEGEIIGKGPSAKLNPKAKQYQLPVYRSWECRILLRTSKQRWACGLLSSVSFCLLPSAVPAVNKSGLVCTELVLHTFLCSHFICTLLHEENSKNLETLQNILFLAFIFRVKCRFQE